MFKVSHSAKHELRRFWIIWVPVMAVQYVVLVALAGAAL